MTYIQGRVPFILGIFDTLPVNIDLVSVNLELRIYQGDKVTDKPTNATIEINKPSINSSTVYISIAEIVSDFLINKFLPSDVNSGYTTNPFWVDIIGILNLSNGTTQNWTENTTYLAFNGYWYSTDVLMPTNSNITDYGAIDVAVGQSNDTIYCLEDNLIRVPILANESNPTLVQWRKNNEILNTQIFPATSDSAEIVNYVTQEGEVSYDNFKERVIQDLGIFEDSFCNQTFFSNYEWTSADNIIANGKIIQIKYICEPKYSPFKATFYNKFGVLQDIFFFKKSVNTYEYTDEILKRSARNQFQTFINEDFSYTRYNTTGTEKISLNTGFIDESYNEIINQLLLSEFVWLTNVEKDEVIPVVVETKTFEQKTSVNDKLINYTIDFKYAHDLIQESF